MNFRVSSIRALCATKWWLIIVLFVVIPSALAKPMRSRATIMRKSCGRDLVERVDRICASRGGHMTITRARRFRRGIVDECCMNKCSDQHIYPYCSNNQEQEQDQDSNESESILETSILTMDLEVAESRAPVSQPLAAQNVIPTKVESVTSATVEKITLGPGYRDVYVNSNVNQEWLSNFIKALPHNSNDFQVGTIPPEYRITGYIPSRARIARNY